jgi:putative ABC transport system permease protein
MNSIMVVMLALLAMCLAVILYIFLRHRVIFKLGVRNIPRRKAQTSLIVVGLMLATLIIAAALGTGDTLNHSVSADVYRSLGPIDELVVYSNSGDGEGEANTAFSQSFDASKYEYVTQQLGDTDLVDGTGTILFSLAPAVNIGANAFDPAGSFDQVLDGAKASEPTVYIAGVDQTTYETFDGLKSLDGDAIPFSDVGEKGVIITEKAADELDAVVGDKLVLSFSNTPTEFTVVAIAEASPLNGAVETNTASLMMNLGTLQQITGQEGKISAIGISNKGGDRAGVEHSDDVVELLKPTLAAEDLGVNAIKQDFVGFAELIASIFVTFFIVFGLFSIAVGILLIVLIFTMLAAERRAEMGMERAVGAPRRALIQQFIAEGTGYALIAGLLGTLLGAAVSIGIGKGLTAAFGDFITIDPYVHPRSMIIAYCIGVVITFLAVSLSSWRVSRLNIVAAVRDIPDAYRALRNRKQLLWGIVMVIIGATMTLQGYTSATQFSFTTGMTLIPFGLAAIVTYFGVASRLVLTIAGLYTLVFWLLPERVYNALFGEMSGNIEMFFVSGICIIAAATIVIIQNLDAILALAERLSSKSASRLPAIRLAISYPSANKGRTGMTIAMFGLIVFSLVMIASINANFAKAFLSTDATAGWNVQVEVPDTNPIDDFTGTLQQRGIDTGQFEAVGTVRTPDAGAVQVNDGQSDEWQNAPVNVADDAYWDAADLSFSAIANGYGSDEEVLEALKTDPGVVVMTSGMAQSDDFGGSPVVSTIDDVEKPFEAPTIRVESPSGGEQTVKVIGIIDPKYSTLWGFYSGAPAGQTLFPSETRAFTSYFITLQDGGDGEAVSRDIERALLPYGAQANDIFKDLEESQSQQKSFFYILEGFMGLGLVVGVAAVGVIALRAVVERRQQIGMMRALGFQKKVISQAFVYESAIVVILGVASGALLGLLLAWQLMSSEAFTEGASVSGFTVPWLEIGIALFTAIVAALLMAWLPAQQASRVHPAEALRYE